MLTEFPRIRRMPIIIDIPAACGAIRICRSLDRKLALKAGLQRLTVKTREVNAILNLLY
jgi:hypothetical protein